MRAPLQVLVLADSKEAATVVPRWHSTPSGVLIITHDMFSILGRLLDTALCGDVRLCGGDGGPRCQPAPSLPNWDAATAMEVAALADASPLLAIRVRSH